VKNRYPLRFEFSNMYRIQAIYGYNAREGRDNYTTCLHHPRPSPIPASATLCRPKHRHRHLPRLTRMRACARTHSDPAVIRHSAWPVRHMRRWYSGRALLVFLGAARTSAPVPSACGTRTSTIRPPSSTALGTRTRATPKMRSPVGRRPAHDHAHRLSIRTSAHGRTALHQARRLGTHAADNPACPLRHASP